jgi:hypothetical protein
MFLGKEKGRLAVQRKVHKLSRRICDLVSYTYSNRLGLSRRVVRNRGSIDSRREEGRNRSRNQCICQSKLQKIGVDDSAIFWRKSRHMTY